MTKINKIIIIILSLGLFIVSCNKPAVIETDILVVGGGASGVAASVEASRMGAKTILLENTTWLGGMLTSAGVSAIDGNHNLPSGFWGEFRDALISYYGHADSLKIGWVSDVLFEPSAGNKVFQQITSNEKNLQVYLESKLISLEKNAAGWSAVIERNGAKQIVEAKIVIDATELGDVAKLAGVGYKIGMDSKSETGEGIAPEQANNIIQDLTYVAVLKDYGKDVSIAKPDGYDSSVFACAAINDLCITPKEPHRMWSQEEMITYGKLPNNKYMINWPLEGNDYYLNLIELTEDERNEELKKAKDFTMKFIYFIQKELGYNTLGLADDEFPTEDLLPFIPYHRESRRINGEVRFGLNHITEPYTQKEKLYRTTVAVGNYPVDHHHARYEGYDNLPDLYFYPIPSFGLPLGTLIPQQVDDFIVAEKSISVTNLVNGATRLQPVVLQIGQAAGALAAIAVQKEKQVREVSVRDVQNALLEHGGYILPYLDVEKSDDNFLAYQRIGATGILKGIGKNVEWANETWLRANDPLLEIELDGLYEFYSLPVGSNKNFKAQITYAQVEKLLTQIANQEKKEIDIKTLINGKDSNKIITRGEFATIIDKALDPFNSKDVDLNGNLK